MSKFKKNRGKSAPAITTASLPDIIFMLLFFFMVVTVLRDAALKLDVNTPYASELTKLEKKSLVSYIYVGQPKDKTAGSAPRIQLGDKFADLTDIPIFLTTKAEVLQEHERPKMKTSLKIDEGVTMGIVQDIKTELRKCGQLNVNYSAKPLLD